jgi:hypothetical protein
MTLSSPRMDYRQKFEYQLKGEDIIIKQAGGKFIIAKVWKVIKYSFKIYLNQLLKKKL